jgi:hypothetical protein
MNCDRCEKPSNTFWTAGGFALCPQCSSEYPKWREDWLKKNYANLVKEFIETTKETK